MKNFMIKTGVVLAALLIVACLPAWAEVKLPAIFSDGMVMQQQTQANLWGCLLYTSPSPRDTR